MSLGKRLKIARKSKQYTQDNLAEAIGTSRGVITNLEYNRVEDPLPLIINAICSALEINEEWLVDGIGEMNRNGKNAKLRSEINSLIDQLSEEEQLYILDMIKTYQKHVKKNGLPFK